MEFARRQTKTVFLKVAQLDHLLAHADDKNIQVPPFNTITSEDAPQVAGWIQCHLAKLPSHLSSSLINGKLFEYLAKSLGPDQEDQILGVLEVFDQQAQKNFKHQTAEQRRKRRMMFAQSGVDALLPQVLEYLAPPHQLNFSGGGGVHLAKHAIYRNNIPGLQLMLKYIDPRWNKSELLDTAAYAKSIDMVTFLLPLSQPRKNNSSILRRALHQWTDIQDKLARLNGEPTRQKTPLWRVVRDKPEDLRHDLQRLNQVVDLLIPHSDVDACILNMPLDAGAIVLVEHIKMSTVKKLLSQHPLSVDMQAALQKRVILHELSDQSHGLAERKRRI